MVIRKIAGPHISAIIDVPRRPRKWVRCQNQTFHFTLPLRETIKIQETVMFNLWIGQPRQILLFVKIKKIKVGHTVWSSKTSVSFENLRLIDSLSHYHSYCQIWRDKINKKINSIQAKYNTTSELKFVHEWLWKVIISIDGKL